MHPHLSWTRSNLICIKENMQRKASCDIFFDSLKSNMTTLLAGGMDSVKNHFETEKMMGLVGGSLLLIKSQAVAHDQSWKKPWLSLHWVSKVCSKWGGAPTCVYFRNYQSIRNQNCFLGHVYIPMLASDEAQCLKYKKTLVVSIFISNFVVLYIHILLWIDSKELSH